MKKILLNVIVLLSCCLPARSQAVYVWTGATNSAIDVASNWSPNRTFTLSSDTLVFNGATVASPVVTFPVLPSSQTFPKVKLINNVSATFSNTFGSVITVQPSYLFVETGSTFFQSGSTNWIMDAIHSEIYGTYDVSGSASTLNFSVTSFGGIANIYGKLRISGINGNATVAGAGAIINFQSGGAFEWARNGGFTGSALFNFDNNSTLRFANGITSSPVSLSSSIPKFGNIEYNCNTLTTTHTFFTSVTTIPINGSVRVLNTNAAGGGKFRLTSNNSIINIGGNLEVSGTSTYLVLSGSPSSPSTVNLGGAVIQTGSSTIDMHEVNNAGDTLKIMGGGIIQSGGLITRSNTGGSESVIELAGSALQSILNAGAGSFTNNVVLRLNNSSHATLVNSLILPARLILSSGCMILGVGSSLTTTFVSGGALGRHVVTDGAGSLTITSIGLTPVEFPVGHDLTHWNKLVIADGSNYNWSVRAEAGINPNTLFDPTKAVNRTWHVSNSFGSPVPSPPTISFYFAGADGNVNFNPAGNCEVGDYTGGFWTIPDFNLAVAGTDPNYSVTSSLITNFSPLVVGNLVTVLPVGDGLAFTARRQNRSAELNWSLAGTENIIGFDIERSTDARNYIKLAYLVAGSDKQYRYTDAGIGGGKAYYRIKMLLRNGKWRYSSTALVAALGTTDAILWPVPVKDRATLRLSASQPGMLRIRILDMNGRILSQSARYIGAGQSDISISAESLAAGIYFMQWQLEGGEKKLMKWVKE